jgi:D-serine deaminase-like pyridoxal phosphate-dependent protein
VTSEAHAEAFVRLAAATGRQLAVMLAIDTGQHREGTRDLGGAQRTAAILGRSPHVELRGFYTHEGHLYGLPPAEQAAAVESVLARCCSFRDAIAPGLPLWPGCSVSAQHVAALSRGRAQAVRPGTYVFGDYQMAHLAKVMRPDEVALHVLATVVDKPEPGFALIDAGSKTLFADRTADSLYAVAADGRDLKRDPRERGARLAARRRRRPPAGRRTPAAHAGARLPGGEPHRRGHRHRGRPRRRHLARRRPRLHPVIVRGKGVRALLVSSSAARGAEPNK